MTKPMQSPANQPIGFWTTRAGEAIGARTRGALEAIGLRQPEWWVLHQLSLHPSGMEREQMVETIGPNATPAIIETAITSAGDHGWLTAEGSMLSATESGTAMFGRGAALQDELQRERMQGVSDEDYATTITVLQQITRNVGSDAWHW